MKKKIAIMLTLILATEIFKACTAEEKVNNKVLLPTVSTSVGVSVSGKISRRQEQHQSSGIIPRDLSFNVIADNNKICSLLLSRRLSKALTSLWVLIFMKGK